MITLADARARLASEAARLEVAAATARQASEYADCHSAYEADMATARASAGDASIIRAAITVLERLERRP